MLRPPTHTDPDAIPRNGTEVPWIDLPDPRPEQEPEGERAGSDRDVADETSAAAGTGPQPRGT